MTDRRRVTTWSDAYLSGDRKSLWVRANVDDAAPIDLELPLDLVDQLVTAFALAGKQASIETGDEIIEDPDFSGETWTLIPLRGVGLGAGGHAGETALVVDLFRFRLAFALDSKKVAKLGAGFAQTAATLSADPSKKN